MYYSLSMTDVAALADGKDYLMHVVRKLRGAQRFFVSSKMHAIAARDVTLTTPAGLCFEYTKLFGAKLTESNCQKIWGSDGDKYAPVEEWKDVAKEDGVAEARLKQETLLSNVTKYSEVVQTRLQEEITEMEMEQGEEEGGDLNPDEIMVNIDVDSNATTNAASSDGKTNAVPVVELACKWFDERRAIVDNDTSQEGEGTSPTISREMLEANAKRALRWGVNSSGLEKLKQMEAQERLHRSYESGAIKKCMLSYHLLVTKMDRMKLLRFFGSDLADGEAAPAAEDLPKIALRLAKVPAGMSLLCDKGFERDSRHYPKFNRILTPMLLRKMKYAGYRFSKGQVRLNREKCKLRYSSEVAFSSALREEGLVDVIPYGLIYILPHIHSWGHAVINLKHPSKPYGRDKVVGNDYFN